MKTKAKLVLALSVLTAGTAVAGATGTFAWFTTNRSATLTYSKITAVSSNSKLYVEMKGLTDTSATKITNKDAQGAYTSELSLKSSASFTTDVSSPDGMSFFKPEWKSVAGNDAEVYSVKNVTSEKWTNGKGGYFTQYLVTVKNEGNNTAYVFLDDKTALTASVTTDTKEQAQNTALANWSRVAILDAGSTEKGTSTKVMFENTASGSTMGKAIASTTLTDAGKITLKDVTVKSDAFAAVESGKTTTDGNVAYLCELAAGASNNFVVSVWLEGTEADNQDAAIGGSIDVTLGLTAIETLGA